jgi:hypothetical protein
MTHRLVACVALFALACSSERATFTDDDESTAGDSAREDAGNMATSAPSASDGTSGAGLEPDSATQSESETAESAGHSSETDFGSSEKGSQAGASDDTNAQAGDGGNASHPRPTVCEADAVYCDGNIVRSCSSDGTSSTIEQECGEAQFCDEETAECVAQVCASNAPACDADRATVCNDTGSGFLSGGTQCASSESCVQGQCLDHQCAPNEPLCLDGNVVTCSADGQTTTLTSSCESDQYCDEGSATCQDQLCEPDESSCSEQGTPQVCDALGSQFLAGAVCGDQVCLLGACVDCTPDVERCANGSAERCSEQGEWSSLGSCAGETVNCGSCNVGASCSQTSDCTTNNCVEGACQPPETCNNGIDDDTDGDVDCADSECGEYRCLDAPSGWTGPEVVSVGSTVPGSCPAPFATKSLEQSSGAVQSQAVTCSACACGNVACGNAVDVEHYGFGCPPGGGNATSFESIAKDTCTTAVIGVAVTTSVVDPTCSVASGGAVLSRPTPTWSETTLGCSLSNGYAAAGCSVSQRCVPKTPEGFSADVWCIHRSGDQVCPTGYPNKSLAYGSYQDNRECSSCSCSATGSCGRLVRYTETDCSGPTGTASAPWACTNVSPSGFQSFKWSPNFMCNGSGGVASGDVVEAEPTTLCCTQ